MHKREACKKILIVKPSSLGDVVHSLPFLNAMKRCFPKAEIHWVIAKGLEGLLEDHPMIDKLDHHQQGPLEESLANRQYPERDQGTFQTAQA